MVVEEGRAAFDAMGHFAAVAEVGEDQVVQVGFGEGVEGGVEGLPLRGHLVEDWRGDGFHVGVLRGRVFGGVRWEEGGMDGEGGEGAGHESWGEGGAEEAVSEGGSGGGGDGELGT